MSWSAPAADDDLAPPRSGAAPSLQTADAVAQPGLLVPLLALAKLTAGLFVALLLIIFVVTLFTNDAAMTTGSQYRRSQLALQQIPSRYLRLSQAAAARYGLDWTILAPVGAIETGHGRNAGPSSAGALGPMQFMPDTWKALGIDANGDVRSDINDPEDALPSAAAYLRAAGAPGNYPRVRFSSY